MLWNLVEFQMAYIIPQCNVLLFSPSTYKNIHRSVIWRSFFGCLPIPLFHMLRNQILKFAFAWLFVDRLQLRCVFLKETWKGSKICLDILDIKVFKERERAREHALSREHIVYSFLILVRASFVVQKVNFAFDVSLPHNKWYELRVSCWYGAVHTYLWKLMVGK